MSPILVRPVREQLEHDRIIRLLQPRYKKRHFTVAINVGADQAAPVGAGDEAQYPDLVLTTGTGGRKLAGVVEVETAESVNQLEAMAQWVRLGRLPVEFGLYVPAGTVSTARRLCGDHHVGVTEIWTYHVVGDQVRFAQVFRAPVAAKIAAARAAAAEARRSAAGGLPAPRAAAARKTAAPKKAAPRKAGRGTAPKAAPRKPSSRAASRKR